MHVLDPENQAQCICFIRLIRIRVEIVFSSVVEISVVREVCSPWFISPSFDLTLVFNGYEIKILQITCVVLLSLTLKFSLMTYPSSSCTASVIPEKIGKSHPFSYFFSLKKTGSRSKNCADQFLVKLWDLHVQNNLYLGL